MPYFPRFPEDSVTFTEEILNEKLHFLCSVSLPTTLRIISLYNPEFVAFDIKLFDFDGNEERVIFNFLLFVHPEYLMNVWPFSSDWKFSNCHWRMFPKLFQLFSMIFFKLLILVTIFRKLSRNCLTLLQSFPVLTKVVYITLKVGRSCK